MGLQDAIKAGVQAAVDAVGDVAASANYLSYATTSYDASAGSNTTTYSTTAGVKVIFDVFRVEQVDGNLIKSDDRKALIAARAISGVTPGVDDQINTGGVTWAVQATRTDPAEALWELQVRRP